jgi:hypothetical protein
LTREQESFAPSDALGKYEQQMLLPGMSNSMEPPSEALKSMAKAGAARSVVRAAVRIRGVRMGLSNVDRTLRLSG